MDTRSELDMLHSGEIEQNETLTIKRPQAPVWALIWLATLVTLTVTIYAVDSTGWLGSDDSAYYNAAEQIIHGQTFTHVHHHNARMAVILPIALSITLLGESPATVVLPTLMAGMACVLLVVWIGRLFWGWWEGLLAGTVLAVLPYFRVVSTTAYPDTHAILWTLLAVLLVVMTVREKHSRRAFVLIFLSAICVGMAASAKLYALVALLPIALFILTAMRSSLRHTGYLIGMFTLGGTVFFLAHGLFYLWVADDFWFKLHAIQNVQQHALLFPRDGFYEAATLKALIFDRLTFLIQFKISGWGLWGMLFWPVVLVALMIKGTPRLLSLWAVGAYLFIAFAPATLQYGYQPTPIFDGRKILPTVIPFVLILGWFTQRGAALVLTPVMIQRVWPLGVLAITLVSFYNPHELNSFRRRPTQRLSRAVEQLVSSHDWSSEREIMMSPSIYLRYRIFFPPELRQRLRVIVDDNAKTWWRDASWDIASRLEPSPSLQHAYLMATPGQLAGESDYGVFLPRQHLERWRKATPVLTIGRFPDRSIAPATADDTEAKTLLMLLSGSTVQTVSAVLPATNRPE